MNFMNRFKKNFDSIRMLHTDPASRHALTERLISWLPETPKEYVVVCIGTDRSTGDSLGPLVGTFLSEIRPRHMTVYGTLHDPVHAMNLVDYMESIKKNHRNAFIIAIDASLGKTESVGQVIASEGPLKPGAALNKSLPKVGDVNITGVVNVSGFMEYQVLQNTRLAIVVNMAKNIANVLEHIDKQLTYQAYTPAVLSRLNRTTHLRTLS